MHEALRRSTLDIMKSEYTADSVEPFAGTRCNICGIPLRFMQDPAELGLPWRMTRMRYGRGPGWRPTASKPQQPDNRFQRAEKNIALQIIIELNLDLPGLLASMSGKKAFANFLGLVTATGLQPPE